MKYQKTITADTISQDNVTATVELTIQDNVITDVVIDRDLHPDDQYFFICEAIDELDFYPECYVNNFVRGNTSEK
jgi:hypothetical protein